MSSTTTWELSKAISKNSFYWFCRLVLKQKIGKMHEEWIDTIENTTKNVLLIAPRGHFKTTILSVAYPLWQCFKTNDKQLKIGIISGSLRQSASIMRRIKDALNNSELLVGSLKPDNIHETKWSESILRTKNDHEIVCVPFGDGVLGNHFDLCIDDDILGNDPSNIQNDKDTYYFAVYPTTQARNGRQIVVGTPKSYIDLFSELERADTFTTKRYSAVTFNPDGTWLSPIFPEHFNLGKLKEIKDTMPIDAWSREYLCRPISSESSLFKQDKIAKSIELHKLISQNNSDGDYFLGVDIAMSASERADKTVYTLGKLLDDDIFYVHDQIIRAGETPESIVNTIDELDKQYGFSRVSFEKTGIGYGVMLDLDRLKGLKPRLDPVNMTHQLKSDIIGNLITRFDSEKQRIAIPDSDILFQELSEWIYDPRSLKYKSVGQHDDCVMSLGLCLNASGVLGQYSLSFV